VKIIVEPKIVVDDIMPTPTPTPRPTPLNVNVTNGLIAYYEFEGNANDSSGNDNNGISHGGLSYVNGVVSQAVSFDGINDYIDVKSNSFVYDEFTISLWAKNKNSSQLGHLISRYENQAQSYEIVSTERNTLRFQINYGSSFENTGYYKEISNPFSSVWQLITMRYKNS